MTSQDLPILATSGQIGGANTLNRHRFPQPLIEAERFQFLAMEMNWEAIRLETRENNNAQHQKSGVFALRGRFKMDPNAPQTR